MVSGLTLFDGGIDVEGEVHLTLIFVREQEQSEKSKTGKICKKSQTGVDFINRFAPKGDLSHHMPNFYATKKLFKSWV